MSHSSHSDGGSMPLTHDLPSSGTELGVIISLCALYGRIKFDMYIARSGNQYQNLGSIALFDRCWTTYMFNSYSASHDN